MNKKLNARMDNLESRFDALEARMTRFENALDRIESKLDAKATTAKTPRTKKNMGTKADSKAREAELRAKALKEVTASWHNRIAYAVFTKKYAELNAKQLKSNKITAKVKADAYEGVAKSTRKNLVGLVDKYDIKLEELVW